MNSVFDNDKRYIKMLLIKYSIFTFIGLIVFLALGLLITKKYYYQNVITFENEEKAYIFVEKNYLEMVKKQNKLIIDDITYDYNIERIEDKNMLYDYEGMENEPFNYMDIATQDYDMEGQDKSDLLDEEAFKKPGYLDTLGEFVEDLLEDGDIKTIDINPSDEELSDTNYSKEGNDTLDTQMCIG